MIQRIRIDSKQFEPLLKKHQLADSLPSALEVSTVELPLGNDYYIELILTERKKVEFWSLLACISFALDPLW